MKRNLLVLFAAIVLASGAEAETTAQRMQRVGLTMVPDPVNPIEFQLPSLSGARVRLSSLKGKVVLLNFWATWCPACRQEMPSMQRMYQRLRAEGFEVLAVDLQEDRQRVQSFAKDLGLSFPILLDSDGSVGGEYGAHALPTTFLLDRRGLIFAWAVGAREWDTPEMLATLRGILTNGIGPQEKIVPWSRSK